MLPVRPPLAAEAATSAAPACPRHPAHVRDFRYSRPRCPLLPLAGAIHTSSQEEGRLLLPLTDAIRTSSQEEGRRGHGHRTTGAIRYSPSSSSQFTATRRRADKTKAKQD